MNDGIAFFGWAAENIEAFIALVLGVGVGIWLTIKFVAPRLYDPKIAALEAHISMQDETAKRDAEAQMREIDRLSDEIKALRERLAPIEDAMSRQFAEALNPERT